MLLAIALAVGVVLGLVCVRFKRPWDAVARYALTIGVLAWMFARADRSQTSGGSERELLLALAGLGGLWLVDWAHRRLTRRGNT